MIKDSGFRTHVNFVPWPPLLDRMREYKEKVEALGVQFILQPYIGDYEGRRYPQGYTERERGYFKMFKDSCNISTLDFKTTNESNKKGKLCRAGQFYSVIRANGVVDRCSQYRNGELGNFLSEGFNLSVGPLPCEKEYCPIESQWIVNE